MNKLAYWEVVHSIYSPFSLQPREWDRKTLISVARESEIHLSGWPIGVVLNREDAIPKSTTFGIKAEIKSLYDEMFDYWELHKNGRFYFMRTLEEAYRTWDGKQTEAHVFNFDTRIVRTAEAFLHCQKLYQILEVNPKETIQFQINYFGLKGRGLSVADTGRFLSLDYKCQEESYHVKKNCSLDLIAADLKGLVYECTKELFELFNWFSYQKQVCDDLIDKFLTQRL